MSRSSWNFATAVPVEGQTVTRIAASSVGDGMGASTRSRSIATASMQQPTGTTGTLIAALRPEARRVASARAAPRRGCPCARSARAPARAPRLLPWGGRRATAPRRGRRRRRLASRACRSPRPSRPPRSRAVPPRRARVVARAELRRAAGPGLCFLESVKRVEHVREPPGRGREIALFPQLVEQPAPFFPELGGGRGIAAPELDIDGLDAGRHREHDSPAALGLLRTGFGEDRARLVETTEHRQRPGPVRTEQEIPPCAWLVLVEPREHIRHS